METCPVEMSSNQNTQPFHRRGNAHFDFFESLDTLLAEQDSLNAELHSIVEQNGTDLSEEVLVWRAFTSEAVQGQLPD